MSYVFQNCLLEEVCFQDVWYFVQNLEISYFNFEGNCFFKIGIKSDSSILNNLIYVFMLDVSLVLY